jgi:site-specific recombinase XerD
MTITIHHGFCTVTGKRAHALYEGDMPLVPATVYLRHLSENLGLEANTVLAQTYALKLFFIFLQKNKKSFWQLMPADITSFKHTLLNQGHEEGETTIQRRTVRQYVNALKGLIQYWRGLKDYDPIFDDRLAGIDGERRRIQKHGYLQHAQWSARIPNKLWRVRIPIKEQHDKKRYKGLTTEQCRVVTDALNQRKHRTDSETMLYYRDRAIWKFLLMSCLRKGELVRVRIEDVNQLLGIITLKDRLEDAKLGAMKTGPGTIYVTPVNPYWQYLDSWLLHGRWIAEEKLKSRGEKDHGLLFCNRDGGPLTQPAVDHMFGRLKDECKFNDDVMFHPHITRHTTASLMVDADVPLTEIQKYLRHTSIKSTEQYVHASAKKFRKSLETFWSTHNLNK